MIAVSTSTGTENDRPAGTQKKHEGIGAKLPKGEPTRILKQKQLKCCLLFSLNEIRNF